MKIFLLAGQSLSNKEWIEEVEQEFKKEFQDTKIIYYDHWKNESKNIDSEKEVGKFVKLVNEYTGDYLVFAKSIGTIIFSKGMEKLTNKPKGVLMVGIPYNLALDMGVDMDKLKEKIDFNLNIYQKELDPLGNLKDIENVGGGKVKVSKYVCEGEENNNHHYSNTSYLLGLIKELLVS